MNNIIQLEGMKGNLLVPNEIYEDFQSNLTDLIVLHKLVDYKINFFVTGTRVQGISFRSGNDWMKVFFKKDGFANIISINADLSIQKKNKVLGLFVDDMDVDLDFTHDLVKVSTRIKSGMIKVLKKLQQL